jgi:hypothetical protein
MTGEDRSEVSDDALVKSASRLKIREPELVPFFSSVGAPCSTVVSVVTRQM